MTGNSFHHRDLWSRMLLWSLFTLWTSAPTASARHMLPKHHWRNAADASTAAELPIRVVSRGLAEAQPTQYSPPSLLCPGCRALNADGASVLPRMCDASMLAQALKHVLIPQTSRPAFLSGDASPARAQRALQSRPDDPALGMQWGLREAGLGVRLGADDAHDAWDIETGHAAVVLCVIDSGIDTSHPDLVDNLWTNRHEQAGNDVDDDDNGCIDDVHGCSFLGGGAVGSGDIADSFHHGTHLAGIAGATGNNRVGGSGVAQRVRLMTCRAFDGSGHGDMLAVVRCMDYSLRMGAHVTLNSYGSRMPALPVLQHAISQMQASGQVIVVASGNHGADLDTDPVYPAALSPSFPNMVTVGATEPGGAIAPYSNVGAASVDLVAPGSLIWSTTTMQRGGYATFSGTSQAAAFVAGASALLLSMLKRADGATRLGAADVTAALVDSVDTLPQYAALCRSRGRLNVTAAMHHMQRRMAAETLPAHRLAWRRTASAAMPGTVSGTPAPRALLHRAWSAPGVSVPQRDARWSDDARLAHSASWRNR